MLIINKELRDKTISPYILYFFLSIGKVTLFPYTVTLNAVFRFTEQAFYIYATGQHLRTVYA